MEIQTKDFGILNIDEQNIIKFPQGLFAFEEYNSFVLIEKESYKQKWLQFVDAEYPRFIVFDPSDIVLDYQPQFSPDVLNALSISPGEEFSLYVLAVIPENIKDMTVNLKSPVVINRKKNIASQVILETDNYPIRYRVFQDEKGGA